MHTTPPPQNKQFHGRPPSITICTIDHLDLYSAQRVVSKDHSHRVGCEWSRIVTNYGQQMAVTVRSLATSRGRTWSMQATLAPRIRYRSW